MRNYLQALTEFTKSFDEVERRQPSSTEKRLERIELAKIFAFLPTNLTENILNSVLDEILENPAPNPMLPEIFELDLLLPYCLRFGFDASRYSLSLSDELKVGM